MEVRRLGDGWKVYRTGPFAERRTDGDEIMSSDDLVRILHHVPRGRPIVLTLPRSQCFVRQFDVSQKARRHLSQLAAVDLQRILPLPPEQIHTGLHTVEDGPVIRVEQVVARAVDLSSTVEHLSENELVTRAITFRDDDGVWCPVVFDPDGSPFATKAHRRWRICLAAALAFLIVTAAVCAISAAYVYASYVTQVERAISELSPRIDKAHSQIASHRKAIQLVRQFQEWRTAHRDALRAIEELSKTLPDHTYLSSLTYQGRNLTIEGSSKSPESLISRIEGSDVFSSVSFSSPVYRDVGNDYSRVSVSIDIDHPLQNQGLP